MRLAPMLLAAALAGCQGVQVPSPGPTPAQNLAQFTASDLANAISIAQKSTAPQAPLIVSCFTFLQVQLAALQPAPQVAGTVSGIATAFVVADLAAGNLTSLLSPAAEAQFAAACGPLVLFTANQGMSIGTQLGNLAAVLK